MKERKIFICKNCGAESPRWLGKCPSCDAWNSFEETTTKIIYAEKKQKNLNYISKNSIVRLSDISDNAEYCIKTKIGELDRILGGGIIPGSLVLIGGDPGIGKSTLLLQMCSNISELNPLYVTAEESLQQIKHRSNRITDINTSIQLLSETDVETINSIILSNDAKVVIIDSIQAVSSDKIDAVPGSISQVRESATLFMQTAKKTGKAFFLIGHITKDGTLAGPKILEHLVDTVIQFEGDKTYSYRILRSQKNRFGSTNEIGVFEMSDAGLVEVPNPSEIFLAGHSDNESGVAIVATIEGSRTIMLEVQALVTPTSYGMPQRSSNGFDMRRLQMILAVLEKRLNVHFSQNDVFVNIAGGVYLNDSSCDLGIAAALISSLKDIPINKKTVLVGEIGLTGEVRSVSAIEQRINESQKLGFENIIVPKFSKITKKFNSISISKVDKISTAMATIF